MSTAPEMPFKDALGDELVLPVPPRRIVSLVPSITETLIDLGAADRVVGITNYCIYPEKTVASIPKIGGNKGTSFEKIDALAPDLVIANKEENRKHHIDRLRESYPVYVTYPRTVDDAIHMVVELGRMIQASDTAERFATDCQQVLENAVSAAQSILRTACMIWRDPWMAAGPDSYMSRLLETFGFANIFEDAGGRYPETTLEFVASQKPDVVLLPSEPYEFGESDRKEVETCMITAGYNIRGLLIDGSLLTWFGTRTLRGLRYLSELKKNLSP